MQVPMSENEFASMVGRAGAQGIQLSGRDGVIRKMGVTARWAYNGSMLTVEVVEKPFFLSKEAVEERVRAALS
jgi:hypothetical protein